jgi:RNA 3'-terminal phosphate cyclase
MPGPGVGAPGYAPKHLRAIQALCELTGGSIAGAEMGSRSFEFRPGDAEPAGRYAWDISTAGSATMLALSVLSALALRGRGAEAEIRGGVFQDFAPSVFHLRHVMVPMLAQMGLAAEVEMIRPGYVPAGEGIIRLAVPPACGRCARSCLAAARCPRGSGGSRWHPTWTTVTSRPGWPPPLARSSTPSASAPRSANAAATPPRRPGLAMPL